MIKTRRGDVSVDSTLGNILDMRIVDAALKHTLELDAN
jgi:hypothetical protein